MSSRVKSRPGERAERRFCGVVAPDFPAEILCARVAEVPRRLRHLPDGAHTQQRFRLLDRGHPAPAMPHHQDDARSLTRFHAGAGVSQGDGDRLFDEYVLARPGRRADLILVRAVRRLVRITASMRGSSNMAA